MKKQIAIILTVYNRSTITCKGLESLYSSIKRLNNNKYVFDVFMTNDGCTDSTPEDVKKKFPDVNIINHTGGLFWSRGMNIAWEVALRNKSYDFYIWFNDDAILEENALSILFNSINELNNNCIITGAFKDTKNMVSYGGRNKKKQLLSPNNTYQEVEYMNGNLVLIPSLIVENIGIIDKHFKHGLGDFDYGLTAKKYGFNVFLTKEYVGITDRHDQDINIITSKELSIIQRFKILYQIKHNPNIEFYFEKKHHGLLRAIAIYIYKHLYVAFPILLRK